MRSMLFVGASLALLAACACAPAEAEVIQHIPPRAEQTPSAIGEDGAKSGVADADVHSEPKVVTPARVRRNAGQESDLLPSANDVDSSPFGESSQLLGRNRIKVLPAFLG